MPKYYVSLSLEVEADNELVARNELLECFVEKPISVVMMQTPQEITKDLEPIGVDELIGRPTNEQFIRNMINHSPFGGLTQIFIIEAISQYADSVEAARVKWKKAAEVALINEERWIECGAWIANELKKRYG